MALQRREPALDPGWNEIRSLVGDEHALEGWWTVSDPGKLLSLVSLSPRQMRLFACACCRGVWPLLRDARSRHVVAVAEAFADGQSGPAELERARVAAWEVEESLQAGMQVYWDLEGWAAARAAAMTAACDEWDAAERAAWDAVAWAIDASSDNWSRERRRQCDLLRDIVGNPFREVRLDPRWLAWNDAWAARMARVIYDERRFADLPILADALEEAGCDDAELLAHCRTGNPHVRGCWVLDAILLHHEDEVTP